MSRIKRFAIVASVAVVALGAAAGWAQQQPPQSPSMTFFVTSAGLGKGADLGGLDGAQIGRKPVRLARSFKEQQSLRGQRSPSNSQTAAFLHLSSGPGPRMSPGSRTHPGSSAVKGYL